MSWYDSISLWPSLVFFAAFTLFISAPGWWPVLRLLLAAAIPRARVAVPVGGCVAYGIGFLVVAGCAFALIPVTPGSGAGFFLIGPAAVAWIALRAGIKRDPFFGKKGDKE
jgi:hypothetical protein